MTFDDILAQIIDLLKRQGRVSYRAIRRRFDIDDDYIEDLKEEILYVHPVIDDEGRGLIWTGDTVSGQAVVSQPAQSTPQPVVQAQPATQVALLSPAPHAPHDAERRQLTVMFWVCPTFYTLGNSASCGPFSRKSAMSKERYFIAW